MPNIAKTLDFTNQTINVGMDVHLKQWNVTVFHEQQYLRKFQQEPVPETLIKHLTTNYPNAKFKLAYETGFPLQSGLGKYYSGSFKGQLPFRLV